MTGAEEYALRSNYAMAMHELEQHAAAWLEARAAGKATIAQERAICDAERATRRYERKAQKAGVEL